MSYSSSQRENQRSDCVRIVLGCKHGGRWAVWPGRVTGATSVCASASVCVAARRVKVDGACGRLRTGQTRGWSGLSREGPGEQPPFRLDLERVSPGRQGRGHTDPLARGCVALTRSLGAGAFSLSTCPWEKHQSPLEEAASFRASGPLTRFSQAARDGTPYLTCGQTQYLRNKSSTST